MIKKTFFRLLFNIAPTPIGGLYFRLTKSRFKDDRTSKWGNIWWYGYLYYVANNYDLEKIKNTYTEKRVVHKLMPDFDWFMFYNTVFQWNSISHILYNISNGYIPIMDDTWHVWDQFFEQPIIPLSDDEKVEELVESDETSPLYTPTMIPECKKIRKVWHKLLNDFCRLRESEKKYIEDELEDILGKGNRILAVVCRGTDYKTANMAKQPDVQDVIHDAIVWMNRYDYDKIYLATEEEAIFDQFEAALPGKILVNMRTYYDKAMKEQNVKWIGEVTFDRENDNYLKGLQYLSSIIIVSRCKALLGGYCGASNMALLYNGEMYERFKIYDIK